MDIVILIIIVYVEETPVANTEISPANRAIGQNFVCTLYFRKTHVSSQDTFRKQDKPGKYRLDLDNKSWTTATSEGWS